MKARTLILFGLVICLVAGIGPAGNKEKQVVIGRLFSPIGTLLVQKDGKQGWSFPELYTGLASGSRLLVLPGAKGVVQVKEGDVNLTLSGRLAGLAPSPVLGAAARLHAGKAFDLDMTLEEGRALIENRKKDTVVGLESYRAWPAGTPFSAKPIKDREPEIHLDLLILKGKVELLLKTERHSLQAPAKGALRFHLSSFGGFRGPVLLAKVPTWVKPAADKSAQATAWYKEVESLRRLLADKKALDGILAERLKQKDSLKRAVAVLSGGAVGDRNLILAGLNDEKSGDVRRAAVFALAHEANRSQAADIGLYKALLGKKYTRGQAEIFMHLLHGFSAKDLLRPETYETLISYLQHKDLGIRELAAGRLYGLVPQGKDIIYDAAGASEERARGQAAWRKLIPEGKLPP